MNNKNPFQCNRCGGTSRPIHLATGNCIECELYLCSQKLDAAEEREREMRGWFGFWGGDLGFEARAAFRAALGLDNANNKKEAK